MLVGPIFTRELATSPRRARFFIYRALYVAALFVLMCTAWAVLTGNQVVRNVGDMARFGTILFQLLAPLQLALVLFFAAFTCAGNVAQEKDRRTLVLLLMSRLSNHEVVVGKLLASLLGVLVMLAAALPLFMMIPLLGGVSFEQIARVFAVTLTASLMAGSLGSTIALWRDKTFQTLALTALVVVFWLGLWEAVGIGAFGQSWFGISCQAWAEGFSPLRAVLAAARPFPQIDPTLGEWGAGGGLFVLASLVISGLLNVVAIWRLRAWNPTRNIQPRERDESLGESIWGMRYDLEQASSDAGATTPVADAAAAKSPAATTSTAETARSGHVDARLRRTSRSSRRVWDNPILWREVCTWAYGRKVIVIRLAYLVMFALAAVALHMVLRSTEAAGPLDESAAMLPAAVKPLAPLFLVSLVIVNALSVTSITGERDGQALDLLLATDLSPREFVFGKMLGVFYVTKEMILAPLLLSVYLWWAGGISLENLVYLTVGLLIMNVFVTMLGIHCGMTYARSRTAIGLSLAVVFFLFLGVVTCLMMMISLSGSFQVQLAPFLAFILGGGVGLYVTLGAKNPSTAIGLASLLVPFATFYAITGFLLHYNLGVFLVTALAYGFTTAAMLIPAIYEFDVEMGRTSGPGQED